ncbi:asparagine synthase (glutamine-hydrolyzing) [Methylomicrobium lacus]|uniref:asparagine synthase (glutamine-hydrolyzing) n=1 Tax=Methylomicrobium lacus TaxID=136992 RepID=UPI00045EB386|nr:asparagine synthase (glutamine-hydrolyzing) [Methylomicrobium lacus]
MCGIVGFIGDGSQQDIIRMNDTLRHRGPDEANYWYSKDLSTRLGHSRLAILDIKHGQQPMTNIRKDLTIVFNGQIYNHQELRQSLIKKGHIFQTSHSDTETILHAYAEWEDSCVDYFNGMWAFVIIDSKNKRLFASRDRLGKKPFFYTKTSNGLIFASELTAITKHPACSSPQINPLSLQKFFAYGYVPAPLSIYQNIFKLEAGCNLSYDYKTDKLSTYRYWEFNLTVDTHYCNRSEEEHCEVIREKLQRAIKLRMASDVEIGVFLSGGLDSSLVATLLSKQVSRPFKTFSIGFAEKSFDESTYFERLAQTIGSDQNTRILNEQNVLEIAETLFQKLDEPIGDPSLLPTFLLSRHASKQVKVVLSGDGADELFAGYDPFRAIRPAQYYKRCMPASMHKRLNTLVQGLPVSHKNMSLDFKLKRTFRGLNYDQKLWLPMWMSSLDHDELESLTNTPICLEELFSESYALWDKCKTDNPFEHAQLYFTQLYLQNGILTKIDRASMLNSLEVRSPFLDIDLIDYASKLPLSLKFRNGTTKFILKKAAERLLPKEIIYRKKKGFGAPVGRWLQNGLINFQSTIIDYNSVFINQCYKSHQNKENNFKDLLWYLNIISKWSKTKG